MRCGDPERLGAGWVAAGSVAAGSVGRARGVAEGSVLIEFGPSSRCIIR